jgi:hypothetical protein
MQNNITDKKYHGLSEIAYTIRKGKIKEKELTEDKKFKVLAVENNQNNGMQAMAVAPVDSNGEVDTSQIVIAYAGTDKSEYSDLITDENQVIRGKKAPLEFYELQNPSQYRLPSAKNKLAVDPLISSTMITSPLISTTKKIVTTNQLETSEEFAKKIREEYPYSDINFTGHSLGGYMAIRTAIKNKSKATVFNAPDPANTLSKDEIKFALKNPGLIKNYRNPMDPIGNFGGNRLGTAIYVDSVIAHHGFPGSAIFDVYHTIASWTNFDDDGNLVDKNGKAVKKVILEELDVENDGKVDFKINVENWYPEKLFSPKYVKKVSGSWEIKINHESLQSLSGELKNSIADLEMALSILNKAETYNNELSSRKENRKETLGQYVADHLKQIQVLDMIGKIDSFFADLETKKGKYANFSGYDGGYFFTKFNNIETGDKYLITENGVRFKYYEISCNLTDVGDSSQGVLSNIRKTENVAPVGGKGRIVSLSVRSSIGKLGESVINGFEDRIRASFRGENNRSGFDDGIVDALKEIIQVEKKNVQTLINCFQYMNSTVQLTNYSFNSSDTDLGNKLKANEEIVGNYQVPALAVDYNTFLNQSGVFDDVAVVKAFDNQVDTRTKELSKDMQGKLGDYFQHVKVFMQGSLDSVRKNKDYADKVVADYPTQIYYKERKESGMDNEKKYYGSVEGDVRKSGGIKELAQIGAQLVEKHQSTLDNIDIVNEGLSQIEGLLQDSLEELIYGYDNLSGILKAHNIVSQILAKINTQAAVFNDLLKINTGQTINGLNGRLEEILNITNNVNTMIEDCFGSK